MKNYQHRLIITASNNRIKLLLPTVQSVWNRVAVRKYTIRQLVSELTIHFCYYFLMLFFLQVIVTSANKYICLMVTIIYFLFSLLKQIE